MRLSKGILWSLLALTVVFTVACGDGEPTADEPEKTATPLVTAPVAVSPAVIPTVQATPEVDSTPTPTFTINVKETLSTASGTGAPAGATPSPMPATAPTMSSTPTATPTSTATPPPTPSQVPTAKPSPAPTQMPTATPSPTPSPAPTATLTPVPTPTPAPGATQTPTPEPKGPAQATLSANLTFQITRAPTPTPSPVSAPQGQFTPTPTPVSSTGPMVVITCIFYDGLVPTSESDEYVKITNLGDSVQDLLGWVLQDTSDMTPVFQFPSFLLAPGDVIRVYTNQVHAQWGGFSFGRGSPAWSNDEPDSAGLFDTSGAQVSSLSYPPGCE